MMRNKKTVLFKNLRRGIKSISLWLLLLIPFNSTAQEFTLATNFLDYLNFGTINGEFGLSVTPKWSVYLQGKFNPFTFKNKVSIMENGYAKQIQNRQISVSVGGKYWFWYTNSGWFASSQVGYTKYNRGGIFSSDTYEGNAYGVTLGGGYSLMLSNHLNLDFGVGLMVGYTSYIKYLCPKCGVITGGGKKFFVAPNNVIVQLSYLF